MARVLALLGLALALGLGAGRASGQVYTPQSAAALAVTFQSERMGPSRVLILGEVRNTSSMPYEHVVVLAEGLDEGGRVVSRGRAYVTGLIPARGTASFEVRLLSAGREKRFRVGVEAYQIASPAGAQSP
ncbi:MAG: FxLYD domain-containing protein [Candidatus Rokubacteria bacterium]|nr:FxLYD domain-containing protein [Candidatus Rokubacteria bacterium]